MLSFIKHERKHENVSVEVNVSNCVLTERIDSVLILTYYKSSKYVRIIERVQMTQAD